MSRTDKDRPYWVKTRDPYMQRVEVHDHSRLGTKASRYFVRETNPKKENVLHYQPDFSAIQESGEHWLTVLTKPEKFPDLVQPSQETKDVVSFTPFECTIDKNHDWTYYPYSNDTPCHFVLVSHYGSWRSPTAIKEHKAFVKGNRKKIQQTNHQLLKQINSSVEHNFDEDRVLEKNPKYFG